MEQRDYFTIRELSEYSHIGINTLYKAVQNRELAHLVVGTKKVLVSKDDFQKWFDSKKKTPVVSARASTVKKAPPIFSLES